MPVTHNSQSGFSMIELLVAVVIMAVGLLGLAQLQITAMKANSQSMTSSAANALAQKVVEEIASMSPGDPMFDAPTTSPQTWTVVPIEVDGGGSYEITYEVAEVEADPGDSATVVSNLYKVTVTVTSTTKLSSLLGNKKREVVTTTLKRAI